MSTFDWLDAMFREKVGAPARIVGLKDKANIYLEVEKKKDEIENEALRYLVQQVEWQMFEVRMQSLSRINFGTSDDLVREIAAINTEKDRMLSEYIDSDDNEIIVIIKNYLRDYRERNIKRPGFKEMCLDSWDNIKLSSDLARRIYSEIVNSGAYVEAERINKIIRAYQANRRLYEGMRR